ncbi:hypothetical protein A1O7_09641 [Cladophialophora yegresii CBS 114405]|uniref:Uncharacterized protein n=1 Tax=Cladophialophora yegresii CBS 114405 TaxID=1182544 RepID=W9VFN6_9EURO|nr:uncharacterized protein A1O7_09641 [Cladophialophora yegresii CBS 114405]EXJ54303.1 hypothetical protein A1O7_09641 [Cladophialophora yegresii CBS 114405]
MVVVSVTDHTQGDLTKKYAGMEIDWAAADKHLLDWSSYFLKGNALRVTLTFKFVAPNPNSVHRPVTPRGDGGRNVSAGGRTPSPRSPKSSTAPEQRGRPPFLYDLCTFARCPTSCALGPYCLVNSKGIHHPVTPESFKLLEAHATHYGMPATFIDLPLDLQRQLVMDRQARVLNTVPTMPVKIGDMATAQLPQAQPMGVHVGQDHSILRRQSDGDVPQRRDLAGPQGDASILRRQSDGAVLQRKDVTGVHHDASTSRCQPDSTGPKQREPTAVHDATVQSPQTKLAGVTDTAMRGQQTEPAVLHDDELRDYDTWQQSRVRAPWLKAEFAKAFNVAVRNGLSLDLLYENPDPRIFIDQEVHEGVACYFCRRKDIDKFRDRKRRLPGDTGVGEDQT